jgi:hypothetical protein
MRRRAGHVVACCVLASVGLAAAGLAAGRGGQPVAGASAGFHPVVVQEHRSRLTGPGGWGAPGPAAVGARFARPTRAGDLLVAAVIDGVRYAGMPQPQWRSAGWRVAGDVIGGNTGGNGSGGYATGGLQATILYLPDNPGGITRVPLGTVPAGTDADVTAVVAELAGVPRRLGVVAHGSWSSGPTLATDGTTSTVGLGGWRGGEAALVLAAFTNGGTAPHGERWTRPAGWHVVGIDSTGNGMDQPLLFDERVWQRPRPPRQPVRFVGGVSTDSCALMVALAPRPVPSG